MLAATPADDGARGKWWYVPTTYSYLRYAYPREIADALEQDAVRELLSAAGLRPWRMTEEMMSEHERRVMRNDIDCALTVAWWERAVERLGIAERWMCYDDAARRYRRYWRRHGSLPRWARP